MEARYQLRQCPESSKSILAVAPRRSQTGSGVIGQNWLGQGPGIPLGDPPELPVTES